MRVPCIVIDRISHTDRTIVRTELRRALFSAYEIDNVLVVLSGRIDYVRQIALKFCVFGIPRCRKTNVDGVEIDQAHMEPGQFKDFCKPRVSSFQGIDSKDAWKLYEAFNSHQIEAGIVENPDGTRTVLAEFPRIQGPEIAEIVEKVLHTEYDFVGTDRKQLGQSVARSRQNQARDQA